MLRMLSAVSKNITPLILTGVLSLCPDQVIAQVAGKYSVEPVPPLPRYEIKLSLPEFSVLNSAAQFGIATYGGEANFAVKLSKQDNAVTWTVIVNDVSLIEVWQHWMAQKTTDLLGIVDVNDLDAQQKFALQTTKSVNAKISYALANPVWDAVRLSGLVTEKDGRWFIQSEHGD